MGLAFHLIGFAVNQVAGAGGQAVTGLLQKWTDDPAGRLPKAIDSAHQDAWRVLELALQQQGGLVNRIAHLPGRVFNSEEKRALADNLAGFLADEPLVLSDPAAADQALAELRRVRGRGLLVLDRTDRLAERISGLPRYGDPFSMLHGAHQAVTALAADLDGEGCAALATVLRAQPPRQPPLLVASFGWFLRRRIEDDAELARGLNFEQLQLLSSAQAAHFERLDGSMAQVLDGLSGIAETLGDVRGDVRDVLDLVREQASVGSDLRALSEQVQTLLVRHQTASGPVDPRLSYSIRGDGERAVVEALLAEYRRLPAERQAELPALLNGLGKLQLGIGDGQGAEVSFNRVERITVGSEAKAEAALNAYRAALERRDWEGSAAHLNRAMKLAPGLAPYPAHRYRLERVLGAGGFGVALQCRDTHLQRPVVVKALHPEHAGDAIDRIFAEARHLIDLHHPALIRVFDADYADRIRRQGAYIAMEWFAGQSLNEYLAEHGHLRPVELIALLRPVLDGLALVHARGLVHRDLTPDNLLVRRDGDDWTVRIIDFGLACGQEQRAPDSHSVIGESLTGKQGYAPWEQTVVGGHIGPWSDIYSLGKLASFALFGVLEPRTRHLRMLSEPLMDLLEDCIDRDIEQRPRDAADLAGRLGAMAGGSGIVQPLPKQEPAMPEGRTKSAPAEGDLLQPVDIHGWPAAKVQDRQRRTAELIRARGLLDPERTRWVDDIAFRNLLDDGSEGPELVVIPAGSFLMGALKGDLYALDSERPHHRVQIARPFAIGRYALTFDLYDAYCKATGKGKPEDNSWGRGSRPVINVSWDQVSGYATWLAKRTGRSCRLPSEAEWEYAARAGTATAFWWGDQIDTSQANYAGNYTYGKGAKGKYRDQTLPVDVFKSNPWGLFQVSGNVLEWCADYWHDSYKGSPRDGLSWNQPPDKGGCRLLRGGSWNFGPKRLRSANRYRIAHNIGNFNVGVRLAQDVFM